jgi:hypothetical protein
MRKVVILLVLILSIIACYYVSVYGIDTDFFKVSSYEEVKSENKNLDTQISELNRKNTTEFEEKRTALTTAVKNYKDKKEQYEALVPSISQNVADEDTSTADTAMPYDIEFLWTIVGNYATEEGIDINFTFTKSASSITTSSSDYYTMADINFTISGTYNSVIEFIYDIEDDDRLGFEISSFKMVKGGSGVKATFTVKSVPITSSNLTTFDTTTSSSSSSSEESSNSSTATSSNSTSSATKSSSSTATKSSSTSSATKSSSTSSATKSSSSTGTSSSSTSSATKSSSSTGTTDSSTSTATKSSSSTGTTTTAPKNITSSTVTGIPISQ